MLVQQGLGIGQGCRFRHGDQALSRRHDGADRHIHARLKAHVAPGHDTDHLAAVNDRKAGNTELFTERHDLPHSVRRGDHDRITQHAAFVALDSGHLCRLLLGREIFMNNADATLLRDGNGQPRFGDRVHCR